MLTDLEMMQKPSEWPQWPFLPVKRANPYQGNENIGVITTTRGPVVYLINLWDIKPHHDWAATKKIVYEDFQSLVDAGWKVD